METKNVINTPEVFKKPEMVTVYGVEKSRMETGKPYKMTKVQAERLVAKGLASWKPGKAGKEA